MIQKLNDMQQEAVLHTEGPLLILAGAGSGKTRVLTNRIAYLIGEKRVDPRNILAITFTNKAADEMRERVDKIAGEGGIDVWVATFHSTCVRILRRYIDRIGFDNSFSIYDTDDSKTLIKNIFKSLNIDTQTLKEKNAMRVISQCKDKLIPPDEFKEDASDYREELTADVYVEYQKQLRKNNALDFDDLIVKTVELFEKCPEVLEMYQERFRYIMVDEYQDTNFAQFRLVELLAEKYHNICVVGDDDQSIYKFRGADIENILSFEKSFRGAKVIKLEQNYRSTGNILNAANAVICHNRGRKDKTLWTSREDGNKVRLFQYDNAIDEADAVIRDIRANADESVTGSKLSDFAVLYRTNAQSRLLEERCVTMGVPYQLIGGVNFYQRKEIKDVLAYLKTINNGRDDLAAKRIINVPKRGIGATSIGKIDALANAEGISFFDACRKFGNAKVDKFVELIDEYRTKLSLSKTAEADRTAADAVEDGSGAAGTSTFDISGLIDSILNDTGYREELEQEGEIEAQARIENIEELKSKAAEYDNLLEFLEEVALVAEVDGFDENASKLTLMTLHGAKGLEFPQVYITGMEEGLFPSMMSINSDDRGELEEERRICYVGITRAMNRLTLTFARSRMINGETRWSKASRFVEEIPDAYLEKHVLDIAYLNRERTNDYEFESRAERRPVRAFDDDDFGAFRRPFNAAKSVMASKPAQMQKAKEIRKADKLEYGVGDRVQHIKFGIGTVKEIINGERDYEVKVEFDDFGMKNMLAGFAKLQKI